VNPRPCRALGQDERASHPRPVLIGHDGWEVGSNDPSLTLTRALVEPSHGGPASDDDGRRPHASSEPRRSACILSSRSWPPGRRSRRRARTCYPEVWREPVPTLPVV